MLKTVINPRLWLISLLATLILFCQSIWAETVSGLYDVTMPVASQSQQDRTIAMKEGLKVVFMRVSGSDVSRTPQIAEAIDRAQIYMKQFRYKRSRELNLETGRPDLYVSLEFESQLVDKKLREAGLPRWPSNRPSILAWVMVEDRKGRRFASPGTDPDLVAAIKEHATRRGLVVKLPLFDLEDNLAATPDKLWQLDGDIALDVSKRYNVDTVLVGRASLLSTGQWLGRWIYQEGQQQSRFDGDARDINTYIASSIDNVANLLASKQAISPNDASSGSNEGVLMRLSGIKGFSDYARVITYLETVAAIRNANVIDMQEESIIVQIEADGSLDQLRQSFALDKRLQPSMAAPYQGDKVIALDYQWPN